MEYAQNYTSNFPKGYNKDMLILLCQNPDSLYAYWEITEAKKELFKKQFGETTWATSRPVIKVVNLTKSYHFFIEISDNVDHCYINVGDSNCNHHIQLGRRLGKGIFVELLYSNVCFVPTNAVIKDSNKKVIFTNINHLRNYRRDDSNDDALEENVFLSSNRILPKTLSYNSLETKMISDK